MLFFSDFLVALPTLESEQGLGLELEAAKTPNTPQGAASIESGSDIIHLSKLNVLYVKDMAFRFQCSVFCRGGLFAVCAFAASVLVVWVGGVGLDRLRFGFLLAGFGYHLFGVFVFHLLADANR